MLKQEKSNKNNNSTGYNDDVRLIGKTGESHGILKYKDALLIAEDHELDLVKVGENDGIPTFKLMNVGKENYEKNKKKKAAQKAKKIKQIEIRPAIDIGDLKIKASQISKMLDSGHKIKVVVKYKGREITHKEIGEEKLHMLFDLVKDHGLIEGKSVMEGKNMIANIVPK